MISTLKKYWILVLMVLIIVNLLGVYFAKESIGISDALEHVESEKAITHLKQKDFFYTLFVGIVFILDGCLILFVSYLLIRKLVKKII